MLPSHKPNARQPRKWTPTEDQKLREEVEAQQRSDGEVKDWCRIAESLPGRTNKDCRKRWMNSVVGTLKKGQWSKSEDALLAKGVQRYGQKWTLVAEVVNTRSADQCSKRWCQSLDPDLDRSEWRDSEPPNTAKSKDQLLIEAVQRLGRHWKDVQRYHFPGRSKNSIKNRYTVLLRRFQNQGISLPEGPTTPEPPTPGKSLVDGAAIDEDGLSSTNGMYDAVRTPHTQVSTPDTPHSWSIQDESSSTWNTQSSYGVDTTMNSSTRYYQTPQMIDAGNTPWGWPATSMGAPAGLSNSYMSAYAHPPVSPFNAYGGVPVTYGGPTTASSAIHFGQSHPSMPRTIAPPQSPSAAPYQHPGAGSRPVRYSLQNEHTAYRF